MKKTLLILFLFAFSAIAFSQGSEDTVPVSWVQDLAILPADIILEELDLSKIYAEDLINDRDKSLPWRYGLERALNIDMSDIGTWTTLDTGERIWRARIISKDALNLSINFNDFYLPEGASIYLFNDSKDDIVTNTNRGSNTEASPYGSWFIKGESLNIEYVEPTNVQSNVKLEIGGIIHGYRLGKVNKFIESQRGLNDSGDCNYDVNCSVGGDFEATKDVVKKAVALLNLGNGFLCSASLVNNTQQDKTPYLLTANHCLLGSNPALWSFRFNWMSPSPVCAETEDSEDLQTNFTVSGAVVRAKNELSDFALVEVITDIPESWDVAFAGWDRTDELPDFEVGIHHPNGDLMKIARDDSGAIHENANGTDVWLIKGISEGDGDGWELGTTESGSSGSPLFNQDGLIIGQLFAGNSFCEANENNNDYDIYGRFATSWDSGDTEGERLSDWLDPSGIGTSIVSSLQNILSVPDNDLVGALEVFPNPVADVITVMNSRYPNLSYEFYDIVGQVLASGKMGNTINYLPVSNFSVGVYFLKLTDGDSNATITKKIMVKK